MHLHAFLNQCNHFKYSFTHGTNGEVPFNEFAGCHLPEPARRRKRSWKSEESVLKRLCLLSPKTTTYLVGCTALANGGEDGWGGEGVVESSPSPTVTASVSRDVQHIPYQRSKNQAGERRKCVVYKSFQSPSPYQEGWDWQKKVGPDIISESFSSYHGGSYRMSHIGGEHLRHQQINTSTNRLVPFVFTRNPNVLAIMFGADRAGRCCEIFKHYDKGEFHLTLCP